MKVMEVMEVVLVVAGVRQPAAWLRTRAGERARPWGGGRWGGGGVAVAGPTASPHV